MSWFSYSRGVAIDAQQISLIWRVSLATGVLALALFAWRLSVDVLPLALAAETRLTEIRELSESEMAVGDSAAMDEIQTTVEEIRSDIAPAARYMSWLARLSPSLAWIPASDHEIVAWAVQADRLESDVESASTLLNATSVLLEQYDEAQSALVSTRTTSGGSVPGDRAREAEASFTTAFDAISDVSRAGGDKRPALRIPRVRGAMARLDEVEEQMLTASTIGQKASSLLADLLELGDRVRPLVDQFRVADGESEPLTATELRATLTEVEGRLESAIARSEELATLVADAEQGFQFSDQLEVLEVALNALLAVNSATLVALEAIEPALEDSRSSGQGLLGDEGALLAVLNSFSEREDAISGVVASLDTARGTLADLESGNGGTQRLRGLEDLVTAVDMLRDGLRLVVDIAPVGAQLVGVDSTKRYLVLGQSADELRATGGFVSALWLVSFEGGKVADIRYHDTVLVDATDRLVLYPPAPPGLEEHMYANVWLLRDVSWEPDFPTTARTAADLYSLGQRQDVDGVAALNQWTLLAVIEGLGSVSSPGGGPPLTSRNLLSKLEEGSDEHGRAYGDLALQGILDRLNEPMSLSTMIRVASAVQSSLNQRDLLLFMDDPELQQVMSRNGWDGRIQHDSADYLYVVDSNVGWSKADRYVERGVSYKVDLRKEAGPRISLTLEYNNHGGPGSAGCVPQWLNKGSNYDQLKNACYWNFWRVYLPQGARLLSNTPLPLPEYSVSVDTGRGLPGEDTVRVSSSYDKTVLSGLFALGAGESSEVQLVYDLPRDLLQRNDEGIRYKILIQKQPGIRWRDVSVEFLLPSGYRLSSSSTAPVATTDSRVEFALRIEEDTVLDASFAKVNDGNE